MDHTGHKLTIRCCEQPAPDAVEVGNWLPPSWIEAISHIELSKHDGIMAQIVARRNFLADGNQLRCPDHWNTEGELPNGKSFYAMKAGKIRVYGWFSSRDKSVFYISHFAFKRGQKLATADTNIVCANWRRIEERAK